MRAKTKLEKGIAIILFIYALLYIYYQFYYKDGVKGTTLGKAGGITLMIYAILEYFFGVHKYLIINKNRSHRNIKVTFDSGNNTIAYVKLPEASKERMRLEVTNVSGEKVISKHYNSNIGEKHKYIEYIPLDVASLKQGFYFIKLFMNDKSNKIYKNELIIK